MSGYSLINKNFTFLPLALFLLGFTFILIGTAELKMKRRNVGIMSFVAAGFVLFVSVFISFFS
ncbi:MAG: DUF3953 domain-containing protein [Heyndrickxia sp.]